MSAELTFRIIFFALGLVYLWIMSREDLQTGMVRNALPVSFFGFVFGIKIIEWIFVRPSQNLIMAFVGALIFFAFGYVLWLFRGVGGADTKILVPIGALLATSVLDTTLINLFYFLIILFIVVLLYKAIHYVFISKITQPRIVPAITIAYILHSGIFFGGIKFLNLLGL